jgi:hypothetical protein
MANVNFTRSEVTLMLPAWTLIRDAVAGELEVKRKRELYLPVPNPEDRSEANQKRYNNYLRRAVFFNATKRTLSGMVGLVFMRDPEAKVPTVLNNVVADATGSGLSLTQVAKRCVQFTASMGRCGLFADYPATDGPASVAQLQSGTVRPTLQIFAPHLVRNWRVITVGGVIKLSLVVIEETFVASDDGFEAKEGSQYRVLRLVAPNATPLDETASTINGTLEDASIDPTIVETTPLVYQVEIWRRVVGKTEHELFQIYQPQDSTGKNLDYIPFVFIGSENNDADVDNPPMYDLATVNVAHYRNSADYEESVFLVGQPTPVLSGLTQDWVENVLKGSIVLGSRSSIPLPMNASATLLQAAPNTMVKEAMDAKEQQMISLGAKLVDDNAVQETATKAMIDSVSERSALSSAAHNVETALQQALQWACNYVDVGSAKSITYTLNTEFDLTKMTPQEVTALVQAWQANALATTEMRAVMRRGGYATLPDDKYEAAIDVQQQEALEQMTAIQGAIAPPEPEGGTPDPGSTSGADA